MNNACGATVDMVRVLTIDDESAASNRLAERAPVGAADQLIERAPRAIEIERGWAAQPRVQLAGDQQQRVAHRFGFEPAAVHPAQIQILAVELQRLRRRLRRLLISGRKHHCSVHGFDRPTRGNELIGQIIEQLRMCRRLTELAEIVWRADEPLAEMMLPDPIHHHPGRRRIVGTGNPARPVPSGRCHAGPAAAVRAG